MGNTIEDEKTTVTVKGLSAASWERAKKSANRAGDSMGVWLSRACDQLAKLESGDRLILPGKPLGQTEANARREVDLHAIAAVVVALKEAGLPVQKRVGGQINSLLYATLREGQGLSANQDVARLNFLTDDGKNGSDPTILLHAN